MKKWLAGVTAAALLISTLLTGCGSKAASGEDTSWEDIKTKGKFVVGLDDAFPPMGFRDEKGEIIGFDIDLARKAAEKMGVDVVFQPVAWESIFIELKDKKIDVIWNGCTIKPDRLEKADFTKPYMANRQIIVVKKDSAIKTKADLKDQLVGIQSASTAIDAVNAEPAVKETFKELVEFPSNDEALLALANGSVNAVVVDEIVGRYYTSKKADTYTILEENFGTEDYGIAVRKGEQEFLKQIQKALDDMKKDGSAAEISQKWFGKDILK